MTNGSESEGNNNNALLRFFGLCLRGFLVGLLALAPVVVTFFLKAVEAALLSKSNPNEIAAIQYELLLASVGIVAAAYTTTQARAHKLLSNFLIALGCIAPFIMFLVAIPALSRLFSSHPISDDTEALFDLFDWFTVWGPDIVGGVMIGLAVVGVLIAKAQR